MTTNLNTKLIKAIIGSNEEVEFLQKKLTFLEKLTKEHSSIFFEERLQDIIDTVDEISFEGLLYGIYKHTGELVINYLLAEDEWFLKYEIENNAILEKYNIPAVNGINSTYDSILSEFNFENITQDDINKFNTQIIKDFSLEEKILMNKSIVEFEDESEEIKDYLTDCERYLNKKINDTKYWVEIYQTDHVYNEDDESFYEGRSMYEGKLIHKDTEEELEGSTSGKYCEISSVFEELLNYINNEILINQISKQINDWLKDTCCPKCKGFDYNEEHDFECSEIFRKWTCSCGAKWTERYNLTKVFYDKVEEEITSENEDNLAYENKQMGDFLQALGFTTDDINTLIINGEVQQKANALKKVKTPLEVKVNSTLAPKLLNLLNDTLFHSNTSFSHNSDKTRIFIEIGNDLDDEEFKDGYKNLKEILGVSDLDTFILVDY